VRESSGVSAEQGTDDDYYRLDDTLSGSERELRDRIRAFANHHVLPVINEYWERAEFPFELVGKLAELQVAGTTIEGHGCPGMSRLAAGIVARELARADGSINTFFGVHSGLAMGTIDLLGSDEQKARWLPPMARLEKIGAFGLTEPEHGSDSVALETTARRERDEYVLNGAKRWIGNASIADVTVIWARDEQGDVGGYLVPKGTAGFDPSRVIEGKIGKRAVLQAEISLDEVRVQPRTSLRTPPASTMPPVSSTRPAAGPRGNVSGTPWRAFARPSTTRASALSSVSRSPAFSWCRASSRRWSRRPPRCSSCAFAWPSCSRRAR